MDGNESQLKQSVIGSSIMNIIEVNQKTNLESSFNNLLEFIGDSLINFLFQYILN